MSRRDEFLRMYGNEVNDFNHPKIAELLFYNGRSIITGTQGIKSPVGGDPFLGLKSSSFMRVLWLIKNSGGKYLTYKHLSHYLGDNEHSISRRLNYAKLSSEYTDRVRIIKNGKVRLECIDPNLFPDNDDVDGFKELVLLIKRTEDKSLIVKKETPEVSSCNRYDTLFITVLDWIRHCDGVPIDTNRKRIISPTEYGITIEEIAQNTQWKTQQIRLEIGRMVKTMLRRYININIVDGQKRYFMSSEGRAHTLSELRKITQLSWNDGRLDSKVKCVSCFNIKNNSIPTNRLSP